MIQIPRNLRILSQLCLLVLGLRLLGRNFFCPNQDIAIWVSEINSSHTSQHLLDPYSLSHVQHGFLIFAILFFLGRVKFEFAIILESFWEILENTPYIIERYRTTTAALGYYGDSIINSLGDLGSCLFGFYLASRLSWRTSIAAYLLIELAMLLTIRDSLTINILMLIHPIEALKAWQLR